MLHDLELYKEYYEGLSNKADAHWALIFSDDPAEIKALKGLVKMTQAEAVDKPIVVERREVLVPVTVQDLSHTSVKALTLPCVTQRAFSQDAGEDKRCSPG